MILNWNSEKNPENFSKISIFIKIFSFQDRRLFTFHAITWLNFYLEQILFHQNIPKDTSKSVPLTYIWKSQSLGEILAKISVG